MKINKSKKYLSKTDNRIGEWGIAILGIIYAILPFDLIPDVPIIGWIDDFFVLSSALLYLLEKQSRRVDSKFTLILIQLRKITLLLGSIIIILLLILGSLFMSLFT